MGTLELYPLSRWDIYGQPQNLSDDDYKSRKVFLAIVKFHQMSQMSHLMSHIGHFQ